MLNFPYSASLWEPDAGSSPLTGLYSNVTTYLYSPLLAGLPLQLAISDDYGNCRTLVPLNERLLIHIQVVNPFTGIFYNICGE